MRDSLFYKLKSKLNIKLSGKRVEKFLRRLMDKKIELLDINYVNRNEIVVKIYKEDYQKVLDIKSIYDVEVVDYFGLIKVKKVFDINIIVIVSLLIGLALLGVLSNIIFSIQVIHTNKDIRVLLEKELAHYDIVKGRFRKSFDEVEEIKKEILEKYRDQIEWLEIENVGTKYIVRVEERKIVESKTEYVKQHVIATKTAIIKRVVAKNGVILRNVDDYVKPGDIVISGSVALNEVVKANIKAEGTIYGEVWYNIEVEYPYIYKEEKETGRKKEVLSIKLFNNYFDLFNFDSYENKKVSDKVIVSHMFLPFSLVYQKQRETNVIEYVSTEEEAISRAIEEGRKQINSKLGVNEYIITEKQLKVNIKDSKIVLDMFYAIYEDITGYIEINEELDTDKE